MDVEKAYIIRLVGNEHSEKMASRCENSCLDVQMPCAMWAGYDGTVNPIRPPAAAASISFMRWVKITDHYMTRGEVACALSHISLWGHCLNIDRPIVILEHDAIMLKAYRKHAVYNSIAYFGSHEQYRENWPVMATPMHGTDGPNHHFIGRAHAYGIDPAVAKNMLAYVLKYGITHPLDIMIRADDDGCNGCHFPLHIV